VAGQKATASRYCNSHHPKNFKTTNWRKKFKMKSENVGSERERSRIQLGEHVKLCFEFRNVKGVSVRASSTQLKSANWRQKQLGLLNEKTVQACQHQGLLQANNKSNAIEIDRVTGGGVETSRTCK
jgi:hypothetical protein